MQTEATDLSTVPVDDLIAALGTRFDNFAFIGATYHADRGLTDYGVQWKGNRHLVMGLCSDVHRRVASDNAVFVAGVLEQAEASRKSAADAAADAAAEPVAESPVA